MTDITVGVTAPSDRARPVQENEFEEYFRAIPDHRAEKRALTIRLNQALLLLTVILGVCVAAQGIAIRTLVPMQKLYPELLVIHDDGSHELVNDMDQLSTQQEIDVVKDTLWLYTKQREQWFYDTSLADYNFVSLMTTGQAHDEYQSWMMKDQKGPYNALIDKGHIQIVQVPDGITITARTATVAFWRTQTMNGGFEGHKERWSATVGFTIVTGISSNERQHTNAKGVRVVSYHSECDASCIGGGP